MEGLMVQMRSVTPVLLFAESDVFNILVMLPTITQTGVYMSTLVDVAERRGIAEVVARQGAMMLDNTSMIFVKPYVNRNRVQGMRLDRAVFAGDWSDERLRDAMKAVEPSVTPRASA